MSHINDTLSTPVKNCKSFLKKQEKLAKKFLTVFKTCVEENEKEQKMRVHQVNNNQPAFGIKSITLDGSLTKLENKAFNAVREIISPETYKMGDDLTEIFIGASTSDCLVVRGLREDGKNTKLQEFTAQLSSKSNDLKRHLLDGIEIFILSHFR